MHSNAKEQGHAVDVSDGRNGSVVCLPWRHSTAIERITAYGRLTGPCGAVSAAWPCSDTAESSVPMPPMGPNLAWEPAAAPVNRSLWKVGDVESRRSTAISILGRHQSPGRSILVEGRRCGESAQQETLFSTWRRRSRARSVVDQDPVSGSRRWPNEERGQRTGACCQDFPSDGADGANTISTPCISRRSRAPSAAMD